MTLQLPLVKVWFETQDRNARLHRPGGRTIDWMHNMVHPVRRHSIEEEPDTATRWVISHAIV